MNVQKTLPTRCLCVGLSFLAAATPVPALAQEVLPSVAGCFMVRPWSQRMRLTLIHQRRASLRRVPNTRFSTWRPGRIAATLGA